MEIVAPIYEEVSLYNYHLYDGSEDTQTIAANVAVKPGKFGLENKSKNSWTVIAADGSTKIKQSGETVLLTTGVKIDFGNGNIAEIISN